MIISFELNYSNEPHDVSYSNTMDLKKKTNKQIYGKREKKTEKVVKKIYI